VDVAEADGAVPRVVVDVSQLRDQTWRHRLAEHVEDG
jgi:hypothetical protein